MAYTHDGRKPVQLKSDPIDPDSTDWFFFHLDPLLRDGESVVSASAFATGGTIETDATFLGAVTDGGVTYSQTYGVEASPEAGATELQVTFRFSTSTGGAVNLGRTNLDFTIRVAVNHL